jgi:dienelactone hydrolase
MAAITDLAIGISAATVSTRPVVLSAPDRGEDLRVRVSAPTTGRDLPVVVFSHGFGFSMDAYGPLADVWAAHGFVVVQPTHLDSITLGLNPEDPRSPRIWRYRIEDLVLVLDELDRVEASVPGLAGRLDRDRIAATGHSYGATTASALLGARVLDAEGNAGEDLSDPRVTAGVLLSVPGTGGDDLTPFAAENFPFMHPSFDAMTTPALVVAGDHDQSPLSVRGPDWFTDAYALSPAGRSLLTVSGAEHSLGGIHKYLGVPETPADSPERVALVQQTTTAFLRSALHGADDAWSQLRAALQDDAQPLGHIVSK